MAGPGLGSTAVGLRAGYLAQSGTLLLGGITVVAAQRLGLVIVEVGVPVLIVLRGSVLHAWLAY